MALPSGPKITRLRQNERRSGKESARETRPRSEIPETRDGMETELFSRLY